jgi:phosphoribosylamine--glycine ligase
VRAHGAPIVIKADGLAAGKGVVVALTLAEAEHALADMLGAHELGDASARVVIEEFLAGEEASYIVMADGAHYLPMASSQDHKRVGDGDTGPNTGGMGAYSPAPVVTPEVERRICEEVIEPTLRGMAAEGTPFTGFLYAGLMIDRTGAPKVIEFNVRFGDPETQPVMQRLRSDFVELIEAALDEKLGRAEARWDPRPSLGVVIAAQGYPGKPKSGDVISGLDSDFDAGVKVFHAGTRLDGDGNVITAGGRVLCACALGDDLAQARDRVYTAVERIHFDGAFSRRDIGHHALLRANPSKTGA